MSSFFGTATTGRGYFDEPGWEGFQTTNLPPEYDLEFWPNNSFLGTALYHFRSDWDTVNQGNTINFIKKGAENKDVPARPGDRVKSWYNTYLAPGQGTARVAEDVLDTSSAGATRVNYWTLHGGEGYPLLVEKGYQGASYLGLQFTGTEWLQIKGSTVTDAYGINAAPFTTEGCLGCQSLQPRTGASFLFVIDQDPVEDNNPNANGIQALLTSRYPRHDNLLNDGMAPDYTWPVPEDFGVQYFRQGSTYLFSENFSKQKWGPEGAHREWPTMGIPIQNTGLDLGVCALGGGARWGKWEHAPGYIDRTKEGFQVILLEYDAVDRIKNIADDTPGTADVDYEGPSVKVYAMAGAPALYLPQSPPWPNDDLVEPKLISDFPAVANHVLFNEEYLFLGGVPPVRASTSGVGNRYGSGFRGVIFEFLAFEGTLSDRDKRALGDQLRQKYRGAFAK